MSEVDGITDLGPESVGASIAWFKDELKARALPLNAASELAKALALLEDVKARVGQIVRYASPEEAQALHLKSSGADFLTKALHRGCAAGLEGFEDHWRELRSADPILTGPASNSTNSRNKSWELLLASLMATFASQVCAAEPDVVCNFEGRSVGVAAKVLYSAEPKKHLARIAEGAEQIDRSQVEEGFVVVNLVERFPHAQMFRNFVQGDIRTAEQARQILDAWVWTFTEQYDLREWGRRLKSRAKTLSILFFLPTLLDIKGREMPLVPYYRIHVVSIEGREDRAKSFALALNQSCQHVLSFLGDQRESG